MFRVWVSIIGYRVRVRVRVVVDPHFLGLEFHQLPKKKKKSMQ